MCEDCPTGYTGVGLHGRGTAFADANPQECDDVDECLTSPCSAQSAGCTNTAGSYTCGPCATNYIGDGHTCSVGDPCTLNTHDCAGDDRASCYSPGDGSYFCACVAPYVGDGFECTTDSDSDGFPDELLECAADDVGWCQLDNCVSLSNGNQLDDDVDDVGNACDADKDNDTILDVNDNCPTVYNPAQDDADG